MKPRTRARRDTPTIPTPVADALVSTALWSWLRTLEVFFAFTVKSSCTADHFFPYFHFVVVVVVVVVAFAVK